MPYAVVQDVAASWERYEQLAAGLNEPPPLGLILYLAGATDEGVRIVAIWDDEASWERFRAERFAPMIAVLRGRAPPSEIVRDVYGKQIVVGEKPVVHLP